MIIWVPLQILPIFLGAINFVKKLQRQFSKRRGAKTVEEWDLLMQESPSNTAINNDGDDDGFKSAQSEE